MHAPFSASGCQLAGESVAPLSDAATSVSGGSVGEGVVTGSVNTQVVEALSRLQDDMRSVLASLNTLEARALSQVRTDAFWFGCFEIRLQGSLIKEQRSLLE